MRRRWTIGLATLALAALALVLWWALRRPAATPGVLELSGRIEGDQAAVAATVGGRIARLPAREGRRVERGQLVAELASERAEAQLAQAGHALHVAREQLAEAKARVKSAERQVEEARLGVRLTEQESGARIREAEAAVGAARARLARDEATLEKAGRDYARYRRLFAEALIPAQRLDEAQAVEAVARAAVEAAGKQVAQAQEALERARASRVGVQLSRKAAETAAERLEEAQAAVDTARARVEAAEASRRLAEVNLGDTRVVAPFAGTVLRRFVEEGEVVADGTPLVTLVDLSRLHAKVYVPEGQLGTVKLGDPARVYTDAFPGRAFEATVAEVAQQAEFTPRDIHVPDERARLVFAVKLAILNPQGILKPGMPVDARIRWSPEAPWGDGLEEGEPLRALDRRDPDEARGVSRIEGSHEVNDGRQ